MKENLIRRIKRDNPREYESPFRSFSFPPLPRVKILDVGTRERTKLSLSNPTWTRFERGPPRKYRWLSRDPSKSGGLSCGHNGLDVATRCLVNSRIALMEAESNLTGRSARASDSSARRPRHQPPYNLLVSSPCFRGHVFITLSFSPDAIFPVCCYRQ